MESNLDKYQRGSDTYSEAVTGDLDRKIANAPKNIVGWGIDALPENNPTYPMKHWNGSDYERIHYPTPPQQVRTVEILQSIERPRITSVFGTSVPPKGLSGRIRRTAYKFSEADARHWLSLILADKIDVIQGLIDDFKHGHIPNFFVERGWRAEWKYNRKGFVRNIAIGVAVTSAIIGVAYARSRSKKRQLLTT